MCCVQKRELSLYYFLSYPPYDVFYAYLCLLFNLNTLLNIIMILHSYIEQVMTMCHVQERQLLLLYFLTYFPLIVSDAILCPLQMVTEIQARNIHLKIENESAHVLSFFYKLLLFVDIASNTD